MVQRIDHLALPDKIRKMPSLQTGPSKGAREQRFDHQAQEKPMLWLLKGNGRMLKLTACSNMPTMVEAYL